MVVPLAIDLFKPLRDFLNFLASQLFEIGKTIFNFLSERVVKPIVEGLKWLWDLITKTFSDFFSKLVETAKSLFIPSDPERIMTNFPKIVIILSTISLGIAGLISAIGTKVMGSGIEIQPITETIKRIFNLNLLIGVGIGAITTMALRIPLGYWARKTFRPLKPDAITLFNLYTRGYISREKLKEELAYVTGFPDRYIDGLIDILEFNPTLTQLIRLSDFVEIPDEVLVTSLRVLGIREPYFSLLYKMIKRRPLREEIRLNTTLLIKAYSKGFISKEMLSRALDGLGILSTEKQLLLTYAENLRVNEMIEEQIFILRTAYQKGLITKATLETELRKLGISEEWINLIVRRADLFRKIEVPVPRVIRAFTTELAITTEYSYVLL